MNSFSSFDGPLTGIVLLLARYTHAGSVQDVNVRAGRRCESQTDLLRYTPEASVVVSSPFIMTLPSSVTNVRLFRRAVSRSV